MHPSRHIRSSVYFEFECHDCNKYKHCCHDACSRHHGHSRGRRRHSRSYSRGSGGLER
ncbi:hypothetical protein JG687_00003466 [Phytophthora cactorum]|uniref:Uncharacterized protein n=2 Tax=Phytophthora TaxID=4783 RepID=A0A8J5M6A9_9STRA|nr:hypothetical protein JG688_00005798 [Phytophthora aleatoria]KAG6968991.1 hypothetical protein JG687_00003466 [Phytophthora cactorum]